MKLRRILSLLLAAAMVCSLSVMPVFAADGDDSTVSASEESSAEEEKEEEKAEEEETEKKEEEQAEEEEKQQEEEKQESDSSSGSDSSGSSSGSGSDSSSSGSGSSSSDGGSSSGGSSTDPADGSGSGGENGSSSSGSTSTGTDPADDPVEDPEEEPEEDPASEEEEEEELTAHSSSTSAAKKVSDESYSSVQTVTAASFSDYSNDSELAVGGTVTYKRLITYRVTGLTASENSKSAGQTNISRIEKVMRMIRDYNEEGTYADTVFKVIIPKGTYYLDGTYTEDSNRCIHLYSNTWLSMNGVTFIKRDTLNRASLRTGMSSSSVSGYEGESNIILEGGTWDTDVSAYTSSSSHFTNIRFGHGQNIIMANVTVEGAVSGHHVELCGAKNVSVVGCSFLDYKDSGYTKGINRNEALQIDVTNSSNVTPTFKKYDDTISGGVVVYGNTFENVNRGVGSHSAIFGTCYSGIVIESNTFTNVTNQAIFCENYQNCAIKDNIITDCGGGIEYNTICYAPDGNYYQPNAGMPDYDDMKTCKANAVISGNQIAVNTKSSLTNASGIYVHGGVYNGSKYSSLKGKTFKLSGVTITKNTVTSCRDAGIMLSYASGCKVTKNKISGAVSGSTAKGYGIYLDHCSGSSVSSNTIKKNKSHGLVLSSCSGSAKKRMSIKGNKITASVKGAIGIYLASTKYISAGKNTVSSTSYSIYLKKCSYCAIGSKSAPNTLSTPAKYGVYAAGGSKTGIQVYYNKITAKKAATKAASGCKISGKHNTFRKYGGSR